MRHSSAASIPHATGRHKSRSDDPIGERPYGAFDYDQVLAVADLLEPEWPSLSDEGRRARYEDFCRVNDTIGRTIDSVQDGIIEKREPIMALVDTLLGPVDEWLVSRGITEWREEVWGHAVRRVETTGDAQREVLRHEVETAAMRWARLFDL